MSEELDVDDVELNDFFEEEAEDTEVEAAPEPEKAEEEETTDDAETTPSPINEDDEAAETSSEPTDRTVPLAALKEERRLRQEAQQEADKLRHQIPQEIDPTEPDPLDDAEAWKDWNRNQVRSEIQGEQNKAFADKVETSRLAAIEQYGDDYDRAEEVFSVLANQNPELGKELFESSNPAQFAYDKGMEYLNKQESDLEARVREKILAEMSQANGDTVEKSESRLPNLASATGSGANAVEVEIDNDDFNEIFGDQKY